jgi:hypothetical protein
MLYKIAASKIPVAQSNPCRDLTISASGIMVSALVAEQAMFEVIPQQKFEAQIISLAA